MGTGRNTADFGFIPKSFCSIKVTVFNGTRTHLGLLFRIMAKVKWNGHNISRTGFLDP